MGSMQENGLRYKSELDWNLGLLIKLIVGFQIINPLSSKGPATQKVSMELRKPNKQDIIISKEGTNTYSLISESEKVLLKN